MSWQAYVDTNLVGTNQVKAAAICGHDGSIWAKSASWNLQPAEAQAICKNFANSQELAASGVVLGGVKHIYLSGDGQIVRAKKGLGGAHLVKTKKAIIISIYDEPTLPNQCANVVESLADYLCGMDY